MSSRRIDRWLALALAAALAAMPGSVLAQSEPAAEQEPSSEALQHFVRGTELARQARWAEALASFERAAAVRPHAITSYNMGACERAIGRYTRARKLLQRALEQHRASGDSELPASLQAQTDAFLREIDGLLVHVALAVTPAGAALTVDGAPLEALGGASFVAGTRPAGDGEAALGEQRVLLDPGAHVFTLRRKGFAPAVVNRSFAPGEQVVLRIELDRLPATLHVSADREGALVSIDGLDAGPVPVELKRPAGSYRLVVSKQGFVSYESLVQVEPGEVANLRARLVPESTPITKRWWFWTSAAAVIATGVVVTYVATRPEPEPPPYDGGSTGWVVQPEALFRF